MENIKTQHDKPLALITGGTSGIGLGIAYALAPHYNLALNYAQNEIKAQKALHLIHDHFPITRVELFKKPLKICKNKTQNCVFVH
jgi:NAD(P)-dependent dehydrogenase (short-subunit alcohol dehydrogenase family)